MFKMIQNINFQNTTRLFQITVYLNIHELYIKFYYMTKIYNKCVVVYELNMLRYESNILQDFCHVRFN